MTRLLPMIYDIEMMNTCLTNEGKIDKNDF